MKKTLSSLAALVLCCLSFAPLAGAAVNERLAKILAAQPEAAQARYQHRHPGETLEFFGIEPGMTVVDTLPGGGWYTKILLPYLGDNGLVIGADYAPELWRAIGYDSDEFQASRKTWIKDWSSDAESWRSAGSAKVDAFVLGTLPASMHGTADAVLFVRALHNMAYPTQDAKHLADAIQDSYDILKPGGIVGVVQHQARENMPDDWSNGENGYLKKSYVVEMMAAAGFEFAGESSVNANPKDMPTSSEFVWRLPPSRSGADTPEQKAAVDAIGESHRMTLKFRKPTSP